MKILDRLIFKAKTDSLKFSFGMIYPMENEPGKWIAQGDLWNYVPREKIGCKFKSVSFTCNSVEEAIQALENLAEKYPNDKEVTIIIDNMDQ